MSREKVFACGENDLARVREVTRAALPMYEKPTPKISLQLFDGSGGQDLCPFVPTPTIENEPGRCRPTHTPRQWVARLVCGATGAGKTETLLRIAWTIAKTTDAAVFYLSVGRVTRRPRCGSAH